MPDEDSVTKSVDCGRRQLLPGAANKTAAMEANGERCAAKHRLRIAIGIATLGRGLVVAETLKRLGQQSRLADKIVICTPHDEVVSPEIRGLEGMARIAGPRGSSHQRNAIIDVLTDFDVVLFMDDDFVPASDYLARLETLLLNRPDIVVVTGNVLRDGVLGPGLSFDEADETIALHHPVGSGGETALTPVFNGYGCNMAVRLEAVRRDGVRFDENLPLYAWLEDVDFSRQLASSGRIVRDSRLHGVHLGVKAGRQNGLRLGYSQIANPVFLVRKGTCTQRKAAFLMSRNIVANLVRSIRPEPWVDRIGRLRGNALAVLDLLRGKLRPDRILDL